MQSGSSQARPRQRGAERNAGGQGGGSVVAIIALDRWGRALLTRGTEGDDWSLPSGVIEAGESADAAALRAFEEMTGHLLEELRLFGIFENASAAFGPESNELQVYYCDPDFDLELIEGSGEGEFRYCGPDEITTISVAKVLREIVEQFFLSTHYRAMFH